MKKRVLSIVLALVLLLCLVPTVAFADGVQDGQGTITVNTTKVAFAGYEWWVIGDGTTGVYPQEGHITLLYNGKSTGLIKFRDASDTQKSGYTWYSYRATSTYNKYYQNNPEGMDNWTEPSEYAGSNLQQQIENFASTIYNNSAGEYALISARNLTSADGISGQTIATQKLWALSQEEVKTINNRSVLSYKGWYWLRTAEDGAYAFPVDSVGDIRDGDYLYDTNFYRPALRLDVSAVLFTSDASASGKSGTVGSLAAATAPTGTIKFTVKDSAQTLNVIATAAQSTQTASSLSFSYSGATTGTNQYISCVITDSTGAVKYYGKLTGCDAESAASGELSVPLAGVDDGIYTLKIFSETANEALYTDFCSEPVTMTVTVSNGSGTVSNFGGTVLHEHNWATAWTTDSTHHWHECAAANCTVTDDSQKEGYAEHADADNDHMCDVCEKKVSDHNLKHTLAKAATTEGAGNREYWYCSVCEKYFSDADAANVITDGIDGVVIPKLPVIIKGDGQKVTVGEKKALEFTSDAEYDDFIRVEVDTMTLTEGTDYTKMEGSTVITLSESFVSKLKEGEHTLGIVSENGTATAKFTVNAKAAETTSKTNNPKTGDESDAPLWLALLLVSVGAVTATAVGKKKKYNR